MINGLPIGAQFDEYAFHEVHQLVRVKMDAFAVRLRVKQDCVLRVQVRLRTIHALVFR